MSDYQQPNFYRFNQDSLSLVKWISKQNIKAQHILDLGAGSGIVGIELANALQPDSLTSLELQKDFKYYLEFNLETFKQGSYETFIIMTSFGEWIPSRKYDLIVANPPYYLPGHGEASRDSRKGIARSFLIDDWGVLLQKIQLALTAKGAAFLVIKNDKTILQHIRKSLQGLELKEHVEENLVFLELTGLNEDGHHEVF